MKQHRRRVARFALTIPALLGSVVGTLLVTVPLARAADNIGGANGAPTPVLQDGPIEILGGTATAIGDYKTVVGLRIGGGLCTGTLIDKEWVLTAAHCITPALVGLGSQAQVTAQIQVVLDSIDLLRSGGRVVMAKKTIPHPGFSANNLGTHDIGLIQLATPITDRSPTTVNLDGARSPVGISSFMVGYGISQVGNQGSSGKQFVLKNRTSVSCTAFGESDANVMCFTQGDGKGKCQGDSGGPTFAEIGGKTMVIGVTSFGDQNCQQLGVDTRPEAEKAFLVENMGAAIECVADGACVASCGTGGAPVDPDCPTCAKDEDCGDAEICQANFCQPEPFSPGGVGAACTNNTECVSAQCGQVGEDRRCVSACTVGASECPSGFDCLSVGASGGACWPAASSSGGCCSVGTAPQDVAPLALLVGSVLLFGGRRRKQA
ncbi:MAG: trypsin-like serine protease [Kofleriaceae bacterium]|nr:trypsin-like serine protease [Kofleriaceae bacterium]